MECKFSFHLKDVIFVRCAHIKHTHTYAHTHTNTQLQHACEATQVTLKVTFWCEPAPCIT